MIAWRPVSLCLAVLSVALCAPVGVSPLKSEPARMRAIVFLPDGNHLATTSSKGILQIWSADGTQTLDTLQVANGSLNGLAVSADAKRIAMASSDKSIRIWDIGTWTELNVLLGHEGPVLDVAFSPDGKYLASASTDATVRLWDAGTGSEVAVLKGHTARVKKVVFSTDSALLASVADDAAPRVWDVATRQLVVAFDLPDAQEIAQAAAFTRDACCIVVSDRSNLYAWDIKSRKLKYKAVRVARAGLAALPDGKRMIGAAQHNVLLFDAETGTYEASYVPGEF